MEPAGVAYARFRAALVRGLLSMQSQVRIRKEAEAVEKILRLARAKAIEWLSSDALRTEVANNPDVERKDEAEVLLSLAN